MKVLKTTAIKKLARLKKRKRVVPGGTSAGKTFGIIPILIDRAIKTPGLEISIVSESVPHLRKGALKDFLNIMQSTGRFYSPRYNRTLLTYTFSNGSYIEFFSADQEAKVRGPRRNVLYINECNNISFQTYHQLAIRTSEEIWLDFNPSHKFWVHEELANEEDAEWLTLTYKDNEALPESIVAEIDRAAEKAKTSDYWANWYKVYGLGQLGSLEGVIFKNWQIIDQIPEHAKLTGYGLDFGYTNDPTAVVARYWADGAPILDEVLYKTGMQNEEIAKHLKACGLNSTKGFADSAEPKSIDAISQQGASLRPVKKGRDSILFGIQALQQHKVIYVTKRSINLIKELRNYTWDKDREGNVMNCPIDGYDHCIDAARYCEMMINLRPDRPRSASSGPKPRHKHNRM